jgi:hypothetical protein
MSELKAEFDEQAAVDLAYNIEQAFRMTSPNFRGHALDALADGMAMDFADEVFKYLHGKLERAGGHQVLAILAPVPPLADQIALDRQQFPALDEGGRADTGKAIYSARNAARTLLQTLHNNPDLPDHEKLLVVQHARLHLSAVAVYRDRLANAPLKTAAPGVPPPAAQ